MLSWVFGRSADVGAESSFLSIDKDSTHSSAGFFTFGKYARNLNLFELTNQSLAGFVIADASDKSGLTSISLS